MPETRAVWGIDVGQAGLKALKLQYVEADDQVVAVAFDYVPHPKILSQPDAVPDELIQQALAKFLSRNEVRGDAVAISVPGQTALARFIQLPPVEANKVPEIVKYEARQQIPFALEDVIWDYQTLGGGVEESGFMLEAEVGLFAMKRDQVLHQLAPFTDAKVEVEIIQIAPLGLYNYLSYDVMGIRLGDGTAGRDEFTIVLDMGADDTTLLISNGEKIWIRNVPIGGNHFTRALTKGMKLTFAKAEHLKCNATKAPDPRAVFQALRPVFNDYVSEIQRSIGYFSSVNRDAAISKVIGLGNGFKLAGLQKFLQQNLQYDVERVDSFRGLVGDSVLNAPLFQEKILCFAVPYGLALQALGVTRIHTTLLPPEIATARKILRKKPWAVATAASLLFGLAISATANSIVYKSVAKDRFGDAEKKVGTLTQKVSGFRTEYDGAKSKNEELQERGGKLVQNLETREQWLEIYKAINESLPRDLADARDEEDIKKKHQIKLESITAERVEDLAAWYDDLAEQAKVRLSPADQAKGPEGEGFLFTLRGGHYHHDETDRNGRDVRYVITTLMKNLQSWTVKQHGYPPVPVGQIGISHATVTRSAHDLILYAPDGYQDDAGFPGGGRRGRAGRRGGGMGLEGMEGGGMAFPGSEGMPGGRRGRATPRRNQRRPSRRRGTRGGGMGLEGMEGGGMAFPGSEGQTSGRRRRPSGGAGFDMEGAGPIGGARSLGVGALDIDPDATFFEPAEEGKKAQEIEETTFTLQFVWKPILQTERQENRPEPTAAADPSDDSPAGENKKK